MTIQTPSIAFVTDASADVPLAETDIGVAGGVPWLVVPEIWHSIDHPELRDTGEADPKLTQVALDKTQHAEAVEPSRLDFLNVYEKLRSVDRVFSIHAPSSQSLAVEHAREAAAAEPNVRVIEANVTGIGLGLLATLARDRAISGASADEIESWLRVHHKRVRMLVVPDRFDPALTQRGLTMNLLSGQSMLRLKPRSDSEFDDARSGSDMRRSRRLRTRSATIAAIDRYLTEHTTPPESAHKVKLQVALGHGDAAGAVDPFLNIIERRYPRAEVVLLGRVGPRLLQQLGARGVTAAWLEEDLLEQKA